MGKFVIEAGKYEYKELIDKFSIESIGLWVEVSTTLVLPHAHQAKKNLFPNMGK
ncbi:hypothetical protein GNF98_23055 [Clostridium perfringens]